jgi:hypothetical protein
MKETSSLWLFDAFAAVNVEVVDVCHLVCFVVTLDDLLINARSLYCV